VHPPFRQHDQAAAVSALLSGHGSLNRSNTTELFRPSAVAADRQKAALLLSGIAS
jgi:hypothetical protein